MFRDGTSDSLRDALRGLTPEKLLRLADGVRIGEYAARKHFAGRTGIFVLQPDRSESPDAQLDGTRWVIRRHGVVASWALSSRENPQSAELGCETEPAHRRRGLARQVCAAWANQVMSLGKTAFYSHAFENAASAALASSLSIAPQFEAAAFDFVRAVPA